MSDENALLKITLGHFWSTLQLFKPQSLEVGASHRVVKCIKHSCSLVQYCFFYHITSVLYFLCSNTNPIRNVVDRGALGIEHLIIIMSCIHMPLTFKYLLHQCTFVVQDVQLQHVLHALQHSLSDNGTADHPLMPDCKANLCPVKYLLSITSQLLPMKCSTNLNERNTIFISNGKCCSSTVAREHLVTLVLRALRM